MGLGEMSKYLHLLAFNYLKNIKKKIKFKNKYVTKNMLESDMRLKSHISRANLLILKQIL